MSRMTPANNITRHAGIYYFPSVSLYIRLFLHTYHIQVADFNRGLYFYTMCDYILHDEPFEINGEFRVS